jgi:4-methylaminobutanoate oxidase (formaldehyde-forming)
MTSAFSVIAVIGPSATEVLTAAGWRGGQISEYDDEAEIGFANAVLFGENRLPVPAWSVLVPSEFAVGTFQALMDAGEAKGARPIGHHACHSLLTSAGSPVWSQGLGAQRSPVEAGLESLVDLSGERNFPGRDMCARQMAEGVTHRLATVCLRDYEAVLLGHEPISIDGVLAGAVDQAAYALAFDCAIGLAYLSNGSIIEPCTRFAGQCEITLNGRKFSARYNGLGEAGTDTGDLPRRSC